MPGAMLGLVALLALSAPGLAYQGDEAKVEEETTTETHSYKEVDLTNEDLVELLDAGTVQNTFHVGDVLVGGPKNELEKIGSCILDKAMAIIQEKAHLEGELTDLRLDVAACCTLGQEPIGDELRNECLEDLAKSHDRMTTMLKGSHAEDEMNKDAGYIVGKLFKAAKKRLEHSELKPEVTSFILKCEDEPEKCLLEVWSEEEKPAEKKHKKKKGKGALSSFYALPVEDKELSELSPEEEEIIKTHPGMKERIEADAADTSSAEGIADSIERKVRAGEKKKKQQKEEMVEEEEGEEEPCDETENQEQLVEVPQKQATKKQRKHALAHATAKHVPERKVKEKSEKPQHKRVKQRAGGHKKARA